MRPAALPRGGTIASVPGVDPGLVRKLFATPYAFVSMCRIVREDESIGYLDPTPAQRRVLEEMARHRWVMVTKYRQAKVTTVMALSLLRDCMYLDGIHGALVAETQATAEDIFERIVYAYNHLPPGARVPLAPGRKPGARHLDFVHGGGIKVLTAGSRAPAVGRSIDRLGITEFGEATWQRKAAINIFPTINKRPNGRVVLESTPGPLGSYHEQMWHRTLVGESRFHPVFLEWWRDESCREDTEPGGLDAVEAELSKKGATGGAIAFRRRALATEFVGDARLFRSKYPTNEYDGWIGSQNPVMPVDVVTRALESSVSDWPDGAGGLAHVAPDVVTSAEEPPRWVGRFIIVDPAGYGTRGDPSAILVFEAGDGKARDIAYWSDREDPGRLARRVRALQEALSVTWSEGVRGARRTRTLHPLVVVESNAPACVQSLRDAGCPDLYWTDRNHPGWFAGAQRIQLAEARLVRGLREGEITIRSRKVLQQLLNYDGADRSAHGHDDGGARHHFDLARCAIIGAFILGERRRWLGAGRNKPGEVEATGEEDEETSPREWTIAEWDEEEKHRKYRRTSPFLPASARFGFTGR